MPSSMSVGATWSLRSTTNLANCFTLMMYLGSSESALMIFVQRATCRGCSPGTNKIKRTELINSSFPNYYNQMCNTYIIILQDVIHYTVIFSPRVYLVTKAFIRKNKFVLTASFFCLKRNRLFHVNFQWIHHIS